MSVEEIAQKISSMEIRGALKIAIAAAKALEQEIIDGKTYEQLIESGDILRDARPTAVSLPNAINYVLHLAEKHKHTDPTVAQTLLTGDVSSYIAELEQTLEKISEIGANLIDDGDIILTICNSNTVAQILIHAWEQGKRFTVYACETRPRWQGHITAKTLVKAGIDVTLIVDSAAYHTINTKAVNKVMVGADTVYSNGDIINKIGTSQLAHIAKHLGVEFIVCTETIKFSPFSLQGGLVEIEERDPKEVAEIEGVKIFNPAFDVTPKEYISMIITEDGIQPPEAAYSVIKEKFAWAMD